MPKKKIKVETQSIHGIYDSKIHKLVYVNLKKDDVEMEYDLGDYNEDRFLVVTLEVMLLNSLEPQSQ